MTAVAEADPESGRGLRAQLEAALAEKKAMADRVAELEVGRQALLLQARALRVHPGVADLPEALFAEAAALLTAVNTQLAGAGATPEDAAAALGELPTAVVWLVANAWRRSGRLAADPPAPVRRLEAVSAS